MPFTIPFPVSLRGPLCGQVDAALPDPSYGGQVASQLDSAPVAAARRGLLDDRAEWVHPWSPYARETRVEALLPVGATAPRRLMP
jgi:hypothetical protein